MNPYGWSILYGVSALFTVWLARSTPATTAHVRAAAYLILFRYVTDNLTYYTMHDKHWTFYAVLDSICAWLCLYTGIRNMSGWVLSLGALFVMSAMRNATFYAAHDFSSPAIYSFDYSQNLIFVSQLLLVAGISFIAMRQSRHA